MLPVVDSIVPIFIVGIIFTVIVVLGVTIIIASIKKRKMEIEAYKIAIDKGLPVPEFKIAKSPVRTLKASLIWFAIGIGFFVIMAVEGDNTAMSVSVIPVLVGIALFISYKIEIKTEKEEKTNQA